MDEFAQTTNFHSLLSSHVEAGLPFVCLKTNRNWLGAKKFRCSNACPILCCALKVINYSHMRARAGRDIQVDRQKIQVCPHSFFM